MSWEIEYTDQFGDWWQTLTDEEKFKITAIIEILEERGTNLGQPYSSEIKGADFTHMRELKIQYKGKPYRVLYAFDPRRIAILLIGGNKGGDNLWYKTFIPIADKLYREHLDEISKEETDDG